MPEKLPFGVGPDNKAFRGESEEQRQARMEKERSKVDARFQSDANLKNGDGFFDRALSGKLFKKKISPIDVAHEAALTNNSAIEQELERRRSDIRERAERDESRRKKYEEIEKEIETLEASLVDLEKSASPDPVDIALIKAKINAKLTEQGYWGQQR